MRIQQVERQTGVSAQSIRFYEREGLLTPQRTPENRYRDYTPEDVRQLEGIVFCRKLGIPVSAIRRLLAGETTLQQCVEDALLDARAEAAEAAGRAELCQEVLRQLEIQPDLTAEECAEMVRTPSRVQQLYAQVLPPEERRPRRWSMGRIFLVGGPVFLVLVCLLFAWGARQVLSFNAVRRDIIQQMASSVMVTYTGEDQTSVSYEKHSDEKFVCLTDLLLDTSPDLAHKITAPGQVLTITFLQSDGSTQVLQLRQQDNLLDLVWTYKGKTYVRCFYSEGILEDFQRLWSMVVC